MIISKLEITNDRNENCRIYWNFFDSITEYDNYVVTQKLEQNKWNFDTPGAVSLRAYVFVQYSAKQLLDMPLSELAGMKLSQYIELIKLLT